MILFNFLLIVKTKCRIHVRQINSDPEGSVPTTLVIPNLNTDFKDELVANSDLNLAILKMSSFLRLKTKIT